MAELAGLSIAANVAQFVVYGLQGAEYLYKAYNQTDDFVREHSELDAIARNIHTSARSIESAPEIRGDQELGEVLAQAKALGNDLAVKFDKLKRYMTRGGRRAKAALAFQALWVKSDIERLHKRLVHLRDQMSHHLIRLS